MPPPAAMPAVQAPQPIKDEAVPASFATVR